MKKILLSFLLCFAMVAAFAQIPYLNDIVRANTLSPSRVANALDGNKGYTATGTDTYAVTVGSSIAAYNPNDIYTITFTNANTSATTSLNVTPSGSGALGAIALKDSDGSNFAIGEIAAGSTFQFRYNGTNFVSIGAPVLSLSTIGASPNANGASITGSVLNLQPASASFGGVVTTGTQTFAGDKTFSSSDFTVTATDDITLTTNTGGLSPDISISSARTLTLLGGNDGAGNVVVNAAGNLNLLATSWSLNGAAAGTPSTMYFRGDGTWAVPAGGVTSLSAIGASPNANGATITGSVLNLEPASASFGGVITTGTQTIGGLKTYDAMSTFRAGTTAANTAPWRAPSGPLMTAPQVGSFEFLTDKPYYTITTGTARKEFTLNDISLSSGHLPYTTTNGRLTFDSELTFDGSNLSALLTSGVINWGVVATDGLSVGGYSSYSDATKVYLEQNILDDNLGTNTGIAIDPQAANTSGVDYPATGGSFFFDNRTGSAGFQGAIDFSANYTNLSFTQLGYTSTHIGLQDIDALVTSPTVAENGYVISWDNTAGEYELVPNGSGGGGFTTADNGLTASTATNVQLGGALLQNTELTGPTYNLSLGTNASNLNTILLRGDNGISLSTDNGFTEFQLSGTSAILEVYTGGTFDVTNNSPEASTLRLARFLRNSTSSNSINQMFEFQSRSSGGASAGHGMSFNYGLSTSAGSSTIDTAGSEAYSWSDPTDGANYSKYTKQLRENDVLVDVVTIEATAAGVIYMLPKLPTACAGLPTNALANVAGVLTICP